MSHAHLLDPELATALPRASAATQKLVVLLSSAEATERLRGLDAVYSYVLSGETLTSHAAEALPHLLALATGPTYPASSALLGRVLTVLVAVDDPPRALAKGPVRAAFEAALPKLLHVARRGRDPEAARAAALLASRFPEVDGDTHGVLLAMLGGAVDAQSSAPLLYAFARVQLALGQAPHRRVREALERRPVTVETLAAALAFADAGRELPAELLGALLVCSMDGWLDPRRPGALVERAAALTSLGLAP